jgi:hypothetical protein
MKLRRVVLIAVLHLALGAAVGALVMRDAREVRLEEEAAREGKTVHRGGPYTLIADPLTVTIGK